MKVKDFFSSLVDRFVQKETTTLASSLAFYSALSLAPLLILFITLSSQFSLSLQQAFYNHAAQITGEGGAETFQMIMQNAKERPDLATISGLFGLLTLLLSASMIFGEMKSAFNKIFDSQPPPAEDVKLPKKIKMMIKSRIVHVGLALGCIFIIIGSLVASSVIAGALSSNQGLWRNVNLVISFLFYIGLFSLILRTLPDKRIAWRDALRGGLITALLFVVGKELIAIYLGHSAVGSAYGVAGSIILLLVWIYYTTLIIFIGAHVSSLMASHDFGRSPSPQGQPIGAR